MFVLSARVNELFTPRTPFMARASKRRGCEIKFASRVAKSQSTFGHRAGNAAFRRQPFVIEQFCRVNAAFLLCFVAIRAESS